MSGGLRGMSETEGTELNARRLFPRSTKQYLLADTFLDQVSYERLPAAMYEMPEEGAALYSEP